MKFLAYILFLFCSISTMASESVDIIVNPKEPVMNEEFSVLFQIHTMNNDEPFISFDPGRARVLGRSEEGSKTMMTYFNGKLSVKKTITYRYRMIAENAGSFSLRDIKVEIGDKTLTHKNIRVSVLKKAKESPNIFMIALPSKQRVFVGEGVDVNYYLYYRVAVAGTEVREYPKLRDFVKRFYDPNEQEETVEYGGKMYRRSLKYSARVFPTKEGIAKIDPIKVEVAYSNRRGNIYGFMQASTMKRRTLSSKSVELEVMPLPSENVPQNFTGLVGKHQFKLVVPRTKFLVNEAVEVSLEVEGDGALENMSAPTLYQNEFLEEFDTKSEIEKISNQLHKKKFEYTFLARDAFTIPSRVMKLYYFEPDEGIYKSQDIEIPEIVVGGSAVQSKSSGSTDTVVSTLESTRVNEKNVVSQVRLVAPTFVKSDISDNLTRIIEMVNYSLVVLISLVVISFVTKVNISTLPSEINDSFSSLSKGKYTYSDLHKVLSYLNTELSVLEAIDESDLGSDSKKYFKNALFVAEKETFKNNKKMLVSSVNKTFLNDLKKVIKESLV